ncbi:MAG: hypothetical protein J0I06_21450 [Planctomycetes bacterium]|nr:hypothetical protein [Planctomycetota bacterium]
MAFSRQRFPHTLSAALAACVALAPAGCGGGEGISKYEVPKTTEPARAARSAEGGEYRILGGMFPADDPEWFFKLAGPAEALNAYEAGFDQLLASVTLAGGQPDFTPPEGWKRGPGRAGIVVATIRTPDGKYEVTVTSSRGGVQENLRRWAADQLGGTFGPADVPKVTRPVDAKGIKGLKADLRGPNNPAAKGGPFMGGRR